jgi:hypothetical protein
MLPHLSVISHSKPTELDPYLQFSTVRIMNTLYSVCISVLLSYLQDSQCLSHLDVTKEQLGAWHKVGAYQPTDE